MYLELDVEPVFRWHEYGYFNFDSTCLRDNLVNEQHTMYMRNACLKALALALAVIGWATSTNQAQAQQATTLINFNSTWRYNNSGVDLGTAWRGVGFNDGGWSSGPGLLGTETTPDIYAPFGAIQTSVPLSPVITYYFRTTFNYSGSPNAPGLSLIASNLVDDGCAVYLNGTAVGTIRLAANPTFTTAATDAPEAPVAIATLQIPTSALRTGPNTIAVEVHQVNTTSSDMVFGMKLMAFLPQPLSITAQPQSQTVSVGDRVEFTVGVQGGPVTYRWQKDGVNVPSTSNSLVIASAQTANAGNYRVIVTNVLGAVTSSVAVLTVTSDTEGPKVVRAVIDNGFGSNNVNVVFNEALNAVTARNLNNYRLIPIANTNIAIQIANILYSSSLGALLQVSTNDANWDPRGEYFLVINRVADFANNNIAPFTRVPVSLQNVTNLTQMSDQWNFYATSFFDPTFPAIYNNNSPSTAWFGTNFVVDLASGLWGEGAGVFFFDPDSVGQVCAGDSFQTLISFQNAPTLFRRTFNLPGDVGTNGVFRLRYIIDDGLVVYLNGNEIHRFNMPAGALNENSKAISAQNPASCITNVTIPVSNLRSGTNILAAAVYQAATAGSDTIFGLEMDGVFLSTPVMPIREPATNLLRLAYNYNKATRQMVMSWPTNFSGFSLVSKSTIGTSSSTPEWIQVSDQSNPYTNTVPTNSNRFFDIKKF